MHALRISRYVLQLLLPPFLVGCASAPQAFLSEQRQAEHYLGTAGEYLDYQFHVLTEDPRAYGFQFEGYLLSFEKVDRRLLGVKSERWGCTFGDKAAQDRESRQNAKESRLTNWDKVSSETPEWASFACQRLDDMRRSLLTHVVKFSQVDGVFPIISPSFLFNAYPMEHVSEPIQLKSEVNTKDSLDLGIIRCDVRVNDGKYGGELCRETGQGESLLQKGLGFLEKGFATELSRTLTDAAQGGRPYTHILVMSMGWNTSQPEAISNYNSLVGYLADAVPKDERKKFRPLILGMSWHSAWSFKTGFMANAVRGLSAVNKGYDADEIGLVWYGSLLNVALRQTLRKVDVPRPMVVAIGHSYGARAISHAVAACTFFAEKSECTSSSIPDLLVTFNGAFNRARYIESELSAVASPGSVDFVIYKDGSPWQQYHRLLGNKTRHIHLWSAYDAATSRLNMIGGADWPKPIPASYQKTFALMPCIDVVSLARHNSEIDESEHLACANDASTTLPSSLITVPAASLHQWMLSGDPPVLLMDASGLFRFDTPLHGGGAHSDIYKWQTGSVLWELINSLQKSK
jgi:hypothetical protein